MSKVPAQGQPTRAARLGFWVLIAVVVFCFVFKALAAIPLTSLWNDELRTAEKSFQPSLVFLFHYLRRDVHPPLYYVLLWWFAKLFGETVLVLRSFSWIFYLLGAIALGFASWTWRPSRLAAGGAVLVAAALPFTVRFAVEGKAYAMLYALICLAVLFRLRFMHGHKMSGVLTGAFWSAAALTHYYGMGLLLCQAAFDWRRGRATIRPLAWALVLPSAWMLVNLSFLLGSGGRRWIQPASPELLVKLLRLGLGVHWPLLLAVLGGLVLVLALSGSRVQIEPVLPRLLADWGLDAGLLLLVGSVLVSLIKPSAIDRYYIVLVPAAIGVFICWLGVQLSGASRGGWRLALVAATATFALVMFWGDSYRMIHPRSQLQAARKSHDFRSLVLMAAPASLKFSAQCRQLNAYDDLLRREYVLNPISDWRCLDGLGYGSDRGFVDQLGRSKGAPITLAVTGRETPVETSFESYLQGLGSQGYACSDDGRSTQIARVVTCRLPEPLPAL